MAKIFIFIVLAGVAFVLYNNYGYRYVLNDVQKNADIKMQMGSPDSDMHIIAYVDYTSPSSRRLYPVLLNLLSANQSVSVLVRPIENESRISQLATRMALAMKKEGRFMDINNAFLTSNIDLDENYMKGIVRSLGYNYDKLAVAASSPDIIKEAEDLKREAVLLNINTLPMFYIEHVKMPGSTYTVNDIQDIIKDLRTGRR